MLQWVSDYYTQKVIEFGSSSKGADWNSKESQYLRFEKLCEVIQPGNPYSLLDFGCGYGAMVEYLKGINDVNDYSYFGYDISLKMIEIANLSFANMSNVKFSENMPEHEFDYAIASGVFNVKHNLVGDQEWLDYILHTLNILNKIAEKGFSFNALTKYSDLIHMKNHLYYADPLFLFDYCKQNFSSQVALLHDYKLYEFTILVRR